MSTHRSIRIRTVALLGGGVVAGVVGASAFSAGAQSTTAGTPAAAPSTTTSTAADHDGTRTHGSETVVTGTKAAALKAAALKKAPGATIGEITTEDPPGSTGAAYEVHVTTAGGTHESLLFSTDMTYVSTETGGGHGGHGHGGGPQETVVTGADAATLRAAALKQVPGATVEAVTTDSGDAAYEVHLTKADGTHVTAKFDKNLTFVTVENGRGK